MLQGRVAFITGGGSGIGAAAGKRLAREGAKVALVGHTPDEIEKVALELLPAKVRVNVICPGAIDTNIDDDTEQKNEGVGVEVESTEGVVPMPGGPAGSAEQVAELMLFLASDMSSHITGTEVWIDGAQSLLQGWELGEG